MSTKLYFDCVNVAVKDTTRDVTVVETVTDRTWLVSTVDLVIVVVEGIVVRTTDMIVVNSVVAQILVSVTYATSGSCVKVYVKAIFGGGPANTLLAKNENRRHSGMICTIHCRIPRYRLLFACDWRSFPFNGITKVTTTNGKRPRWHL
jgi:hypothetical protein